MAKKKTTPRPKQTRIAGTFDEVPKVVTKAADAYMEAKRQKAEWLTDMNQRKDALIEVMQEHNVAEVEIDDGEKKIVLVDSSTVKVQTIKDGKGGDSEE